MKSKKHHDEDLFYKFIFRKLKIRMHHYLGYGGKKMDFQNPEQVPLSKDDKFMDVAYIIDDKTFYNVENQSTPTYEEKLQDIYKYHIYGEVESGMPLKSVVFSTANPNHGIEKLKIDYGMKISPDYIYLKNKNISKILSNLEYKVENNLRLSDSEAIDLLLLPDMNWDIELNTEELFEIICSLLRDAYLSDEEFKRNLIKCEQKMLKRFFTKEKAEEFEKMIHFKAEDYGLEPNVTGFEEELEIEYNFGYKNGKLDGEKEGKKEGKKEIAKKLLKKGMGETEIKNITELTQEDIEKLKKEMEND